MSQKTRVDVMGNPPHSVKTLSLFLLATGLLVGHGLNYAESTASVSGYQPYPFTIDTAQDRIVPIDLNGDGLKDILAANEARLSIYFQQADNSDSRQPFNFSQADITLDLPGSAVGWDLDWDTSATNQSSASTNKSLRIIAVVDGKQIIAWPVIGKNLGKQQVLLSGLPGSLPLGAYPLNFVRDINNDQRNDYILPGAEHHHLYLQDAQGQFGNDIQIKSNIWISSSLAVANDLTGKVGQRVRIPEFRIRDVNGDGIKDLISRANDLLEVFLAQDDGRYNTQPNYRYDFNEVEERLGEPDLDNIDFSNLSAMTRYSYNMKLDDINGDNIDDLLLREGGKVVFYTGTATGMNLDQPQQVLRSSGNVFSASLLDEDQDGLKDLWLTRVEDISLGKAFVWLALSGSITIEAFIYKNQGQRFASRPHRKKTITLTFPSILKTIGLTSELGEKAKSTTITRTLSANLSDDDAARDLLVLDEHGIRVHLGVLEQHLIDQEMFLGLISNIREKDQFVIDLGDILNNAGIEGQTNLELVKDREQDFLLSLGETLTDIDVGSDLMAMDLNNDNKDDVLVLAQRDDNKISGVLLLSQ